MLISSCVIPAVRWMVLVLVVVTVLVRLLLAVVLWTVLSLLTYREWAVAVYRRTRW